MKTLSSAEFLAANPGAAGIEEAFARYLRENNKRFNEIFSIKADDRMVLSGLIQRYRPKTIIETGTNIGTSTVVMALSSDAQIHTFDIADMVPGPSQCNTSMFGYLFQGTPLSKRISARYASTYTLDPRSLPVADLWFVDSDHSFKTVEHETNLALANMSEKGGVIIYHDASTTPACETDVATFLQQRFADCTLVDTRCGIAFVEVPAATGA